MTKRLKFNKVRTKLILAVSALIFILSLLAFLIVPNRIEKILLSATEQKADHISDMMVHGVAPILFHENREGMSNILGAVRQNSDIDHLYILRNDSSVFAEYHRSPVTGSGISDKKYYTVFKDVRFDNRELGSLALSFSMKRVWHDVKLARIHLAISTAVLFILSVLSVILITRVFAAPFNQMLKTVEKVASGEPAARANVKTDDEIGFLAREFDIMLDRLMTAYQTLDNLNKDLEVRIESRTAALRLSNAQLKAELKERRQIERELSAERVRLMATLSKIDEGVITTDINNNISVMNRVAAEITGWNEIEAIGKPIVDVFKLPVSDDGGENIRDIQEFLQQLDHREHGSLITIVDSGSREKKLNINVIPIHSLYGEKNGTVFIFHLWGDTHKGHNADLRKYQA